MKKLWVSTFCFIILMVTAVAWTAPVPDTGQTKCYDNTKEITCPSPGQPFYGQDANYTINPMSYTKLDANGNALPASASSWVMVKDNVTGLVWEMKTNKDGKEDYSNPHDADNTYTWYDSNPATNGGYAGTPGNGTDTEDFIKALNDAHYGGYTDWRLPTIKELAYIVDHNVPYPELTINISYFPDTAVSLYWSINTLISCCTGNAWIVDFVDDGDHSNYSNNSFKGSYDYVRAVRGGQAEPFDDSVIGLFETLGGDGSYEMASAGSYTDNGDGTVTDVRTGLMWQKGFSSESMHWEEALAYCEGLNLGGYTDWRLPNKKELRSLVDYSCYNPAINTTFFPNTSNWYYCSSTTHANRHQLAWSISFDDGYDSLITKDYSCYVRSVRVGQSGSLGNLVISPLSRSVPKEAGSTTFGVSNTGTGTMPWTATVISGGEWLTITSGSSGSNAGTVTCGYTANTSTTSRTATIRVTATGATGSPTDVTVTQAGTPVQTVLSVIPASRVVVKDAGSTIFSVSNSGTGTMTWTAAVTSGGGWMRIISGASGSDSGTITCAFDANTGASSRTAGIRITAPGATGSPVDVSVTQAANTTQCTATIDGKLSLHIPLLSHLIPWWGAPSYTVDMVYEYNPSYPTLIPFKLTHADFAQSGVYLCDPSTLADDFTIHILDALMSDGITRMWMDLTYSQALSTNGVCFYVSNYGVVAK